MAAGPPPISSLIDDYYAGLYRYAYRLSGCAADADDLTQETFRKALTRLGQLRDPARAKPWLYRILRNGYLHRVRGEKRSRVVPLDGVPEVPGREALPEAAVDPAQLQAALNDLDETFRTPVILFYFEEFSYKDIADQLDVPIGTVMSRLARAKSYLRAKLAPYDPKP
jgi:RNA polymerase sigma-70 factor (ECF subfamily)